MNIRYDTYDFAVGQQVYEERRQATFNEFYQRIATEVRIRIRGELLVPNNTAEADQATTLVALENSFRTAFAKDGGDFRVTYPDGTEELFLRSADFVGGLRVLEGPYFPGDAPGELVRRRTFEVTIGGERLDVDDPGGPIEGVPPTVTYTQTLTYEGNGGPRFVIIETLEGAPIKQQTNAATVSRCVQRGTYIWKSDTTYPTAPDMKYPADEKRDLRVLSFLDPAAGSKGIEWQYVFESATPFS